MALAGRVARWTSRFWLGGLVQPGERPILVALEELGARDVWVVTTEATYINAKPTRANRRQKGGRNLRIPHTSVTGLHHVEQGQEATLTVVAVHEGGTREYSGGFSRGDAAQLARLLSREAEVEIAR